ncbi:MAG TPA: class II aldolase/adducin family protein [Candidatus Onthocola gallistercoris]|uniref:Class II aldolase/adducin family protein n=1 Tax=Candidatus Onthocola gallistercoris TaxID=2840876 RepID=A0A9D1KVX5_9FIRM|nr:class II aldolase/adducin family protein [Candidatus Onthocola gallistercoris]
MGKEELKQEIITTVKREYKNQMVNMFEGNVSAKWGESIFITPSQVSKEIITADMLIEMDLQGNIIHQPDGFRPSSETKMHLEVYRLRPDVKAVVHNHSLYATAYAVNNMPLESDALTEMNITFGSVPVVPYGTPGTDRIYEKFPEYIMNRYAVLLANHGVLTFGRTLELAYSYAEAVEKIAQTLYVAGRLGPAANIPAEEAEALRQYGASKREAQIRRYTQE